MNASRASAWRQGHDLRFALPGCLGVENADRAVSPYGKSVACSIFGVPLLKTAIVSIFYKHAWLGNLDSNQDKQSQSLLCYRYTIPHLSH